MAFLSLYPVINMRMITFHDNFNKNKDIVKMLSDFLESFNQKTLEIFKDITLKSIHYVNIFLQRGLI